MVRFGMHFSLWAPSFTREAAEAALPEAARHGIEVIEIPLLEPETVDVQHARNLLEATGIAPSASLCLPLKEMATVDPAAAEKFLDRALGVAHRLGCRFLGGVIYSTLGYRSGKPPTEAEYDAIARALRPVAKRAEGLGITLGIEPCNRYETHLVNTAAQAEALIARVGQSNLAVHLDTYHMNIEEKGFAAGLKAAAAHLSYIHLSESDRGVPGTGTVAWDEVFATLAEIGFSGDLVGESFITLPPAIAAALSVWRPVAPDRHAVLKGGLQFLRARARAHGLAMAQ